MQVPGRHNAENGAMAACCALSLGIDAKVIEKALSEYKGLSRRLEYKGKFRGYDVYYDYAHHPSEIREAIGALRLLTDAELTVVFKPHTYSRTAAFFSEFARALSLADRVLLTDIYPAREEPIENITSEALAQAIGERAIYCAQDDVLPFLNGSGIVVLMGAGNYPGQITKSIFVNKN